MTDAQKKNIDFALAQLRHAYMHLMNGTVKEENHRQFASGLIGHSIETLEWECDQLSQERIVRAAILYRGGVYSVDRPGRHHDVIAMMRIDHGLDAEAMREQGFVTSDGRYVGRKHALAIAVPAGQVIHKHGNPSELYSEDLW